MSKWFTDTFLPSIYERTDGKGQMLTAKQVAICQREMEAHTGRTQTYYGSSRPITWYSIEWAGRQVTLSASFPNGCARLDFGRTAEEQEAAEQEATAERERIHAGRLERIRRNPERLERRITQLREQLESWKEELELDLEDGLQEEAEQDRQAIQEIESELEALTK